MSDVLFICRRLINVSVPIGHMYSMFYAILMVGLFSGIVLSYDAIPISIGGRTTLPENGEGDDDLRLRLPFSVMVGGAILHLELRPCAAGPTERRIWVHHQHGRRVQLHRLHGHTSSASSTGGGGVGAGCLCRYHLHGW